MMVIDKQPKSVEPMECGCDGTKRRWKIARAVLLLSGLSLAAYMPWKAATQFESLRSIYGPWFLQGAVVAAAGVLLMIRPVTGLRLPLILRLGVGVAAVLWMRTGLLCTPSLIDTITASPAAGLFATFHMFVQHILLSVGVLLVATVPRPMIARLDPHTLCLEEPAAAIAAKVVG